MQLHANLEDSKRKVFNFEQANHTLNTEKRRLEHQVSMTPEINNNRSEELDRSLQSERFQECIYELEKETRKLKAENDYHQKIMEKKNANLSELRSQILSWQKEVEKLERELFVAKEAYEKSDRRMKEIFSSQHEPLTIEDLRGLVSASPILSMRNISVTEQSISGRNLTGDRSISLSNIYPLDSFSSSIHY